MKLIIIFTFIFNFVNLYASDLTIKITSSDKVKCTGKIDLNINGGYAPYDIEWTGPNGLIKSELGINGMDGKEDVDQLCANSTYCVYITDALCGVLQYCWNMEACPIITLGLTYTPNPPTSCNNSDGSITIRQFSAYGGTAPYTLHLEDSKGNKYYEDPITFRYLNLKSGFYEFVATDANGCEGREKLVLLASDAFFLNSDIQQPCPGQSNGKISVYAFGMNPSEKFNYKWSTGFTELGLDPLVASIIDNLSTGRYCVTVTSELTTCEITECYDLNSNPPSPLSWNPISLKPCPGVANGSILLNVKGGTLPYTYTWMPQTSIPGSLLRSGDYCITVTDFCGMSLHNCFEIKELEFDLNYSILCENQGTANINIKYGNPPYRITWSNGASSTSINNLSDGDYDIRVKDARGCMVRKTFSLKYEKRVSLFDLKNNSSCKGNVASCDGFIELQTKNNEQFTYNWTGPYNFTSNDKRIINLCAGTYYVSATDSKGCIEKLNFIICCCSAENTDLPSCGITPPLTITALKKSPKTKLSNDGYIHLTVTGGLNFKKIDWTGPNGFISNQLNIDNIGPGNYCVTISDGCQVKTECYNIVPCDEKNFKLNENLTHTCKDISLGKITIDPQGIGKPFIILWENGSTSTVRDFLSKVFYSVKITDNEQCEYNFAFEIKESNPISYIRGYDPKAPCNTCAVCNLTCAYYTKIVNQIQVVKDDCSYWTACEDMPEIPILNSFMKGNKKFEWTGESCSYRYMCAYGVYTQEKSGQIVTEHFEGKQKNATTGKDCYYCFDADICYGVNEEGSQVRKLIGNVISNLGVSTNTTCPSNLRQCQVIVKCGEVELYRFCSSDSVYYCNQLQVDYKCAYVDVINPLHDTTINGETFRMYSGEMSKTDAEKLICYHKKDPYFFGYKIDYESELNYNQIINKDKIGEIKMHFIFSIDGKLLYKSQFIPASNIQDYLRQQSAQNGIYIHQTQYDSGYIKSEKIVFYGK